MDNTLDRLDDDTLVLQCKNQLPYIQTGFEELVRRHENKVFNLCRRYLTSEADAEDATQDVFMKVFHALPDFDQRSAFTTWLFSIVINHCKTLLGKRSRDQQRFEYGNEQAEEMYEDDEADTARAYESEDDKNCIHGAMRHMKEGERDMLLLRFGSELPLDEIAKILGKKLSATKMTFYRALDKFKALYEKYCT